MNEFITQRFTKTDSTDLEPVCHEPPTLEQSLAWLNSQGECAAIALAHFNDQIASLQREKVIAKEINDALITSNSASYAELKTYRDAVATMAQMIKEREYVGHPMSWSVIDNLDNLHVQIIGLHNELSCSYLDKAGEA